MVKFDANKHKKTKQRLTDLQGELENSVVPTHKPHPPDWIRAQGNSVDDLHQVLITIQPDVSGEQETYLIQAEDEKTEDRLLQILLPVKSVILAPCITSFGKYFIWPAKQAGPNMREMESHISARKCIEKAQKGWRKISWSSANKIYECRKPESEEGFEKPVWPDKPYEDLITEAYDAHIITNESHPVVLRAKGIMESKGD